MNLDPHFSQAERQYADGASKEALSAYLSCLAIRLAEMEQEILSSGGKSPELMDIDYHILERISDLSITLGAISTGHACLDLMLSMAVQVGNEFLSEYSRLRIADFYLEASNIQAFQKTLKETWFWKKEQQAFPIRNRPFDDSQSDFLGIFYQFIAAKWAAVNGQYVEANSKLDSLRKRIQSIGTSSQFSAQISGFESSIAYLHLLVLMGCGEFEQAIDALRDLPGDSPFDQLHRLQFRYHLELGRGNLGGALDLGDQILLLNDQVRSNSAGFTSLFALIHLYQFLNLTNQVEAAIGKMEEMAQAAQHPDYGRMLAQAKLMIQSHANRQGSSAVNSRVVHTSFIAFPYVNAGAKVSFVSQLHELGLLLDSCIMAGDIDRARQLDTRLSQLAQESDSPLIQHRSLLYRFRMKSLTCVDFSIESLKGALFWFESKGLIVDLLHLHELLADHFSFESDLGYDAYSLIDNCLSTLRISLPVSIRPLFMLDKWTARDRLLESTIHSIHSSIGSLNAIQMLMGIRKLGSRILSFFADRDATSMEQITIPRGTAPTASFLDGIAWNEAKIVFTTTPSGISCIILGWFLVKPYFITLSRLALNRLVDRIIDMVPRYEAGAVRDLSNSYSAQFDSLEGAETSFMALMDDVYLALDFARLLNLLPSRISRLTLVPDGLLNKIPFASLRHKGKFLIERYVIELRQRAISPNSRLQAPRQAAIIGVGAGSALVAPLPTVTSEIESLTEVLLERHWTVQHLLEKDATRDSLLSAMSSSSIMHIATHGKFYEQSPLDSSIHMGKGPPVLLRDVLNVTHPVSVQLMMMTSCWGAVSRTLDNKWVIGFPEAFGISGIRSVVANLWEVDDSVCAEFVREFYLHFHRKGSCASLRKAQLRLLRQEGWSSPWFWGGFCAWGDFRPKRESMFTVKKILRRILRI